MASRTLRIGLGAFAGAAALAVSGIATVSAHEHRTVAGYSVLVGWADEPTFSGVRNAVQFFVNDAQGHPVNDVGDSVKVEVIYKDHTAPLTLMPSFDPDTGMGTQGEYDAAILPMKAGTYTFHFTGTIHGKPIDEKFTSSETTFDNVDDRSSIEFPGGAEKAAEKPAEKPADAPAAKGATLGLVAVPLVVLLGGARLATAVRRRRRTPFAG